MTRVKTQQDNKIMVAAERSLGEMLDPKQGRTQPMAGFDDEFVDIVHYIVLITHRIWDLKKIDLCRRYYSADSAIHTMTGDIIGAALVEQNTHATLASFPDRTLDADNVIWSGNETDGYYSSHLITSHMTNLGDSPYGPASGRQARIQTIADCLCRDNMIVEEWLVRDNASLVRQLGFDIKDIASTTAQCDVENNSALLTYWSDAFAEHQALPVSSFGLALPNDGLEEFAHYLIETAWADGDEAIFSAVYDYRADIRWPDGRSFYGGARHHNFLRNWRQAFSNLKLTVDHIACVPYLQEGRDVALRWRLTGTYSQDGPYGPATGKPVYILGCTQTRIINNQIHMERTIFDELALWRQIAVGRLGAL